MRRFALLLVLLLAACKGCQSADPPDNYAVEKLADPYAKAPARGQTPDLERSAAVIGQVAKQLGYGDVPVNVLRKRSNEAWVGRLVLFVSHGGTEQLSAAWRDVLSSCVEAYHVPMEIKVKLRQAEARVYDYQHDKVDDETMRAEYLAEITWTLYLLGSMTADAGF